MRPHDREEGPHGRDGHRMNRFHMDEAHIQEHMKAFKQFHLLVVIVDRNKEKQASEILRDSRVHGYFMSLAYGTAKSSLMDIIGLSQEEKAMIFSFIPGKFLPVLLSYLKEKQQAGTLGQSIAYTVPMSGLMKAKLPIEMDNFMCDWQKEMEKEATSMSEHAEHDLIVIIVNEGSSEEVMEAAREAGATGGTVFQALRFGMEEAARFFGLAMHDRKDVVTILTDRENKWNIMKAIKEMNSENQNRCMIFSLPVDNVVK